MIVLLYTLHMTGKIISLTAAQLNRGEVVADLGVVGLGHTLCHNHDFSYDTGTGWFQDADMNVINISCKTLFHNQTKINIDYIAPNTVVRRLNLPVLVGLLSAIQPFSHPLT